MRRRTKWWSGALCVVVLGTGCPGGGGSGDGGSGDDGCPDGVCLPTETPGDDTNGTADSGMVDTGSDDGDTDLPPDGVCDETACDPWDIPSPPDGTAMRECSDPDCPLTTDLPDLDENFFRCRVFSVFQDGCANLGCHSPQTPARQLRLYARWQEREFPIHSGSQDLELLHDCSQGFPASATCDRHPLTALEWATNFDSARLFAIGVDSGADSELVTQPLAEEAGGLTHDGFDIWASTSDVRYQTLVEWLDGATEAADCPGLTVPPVVGSVDDTVFGYFQFDCPQCREAGDVCVDSGQTPPCDPNACLP